MLCREALDLVEPLASGDQPVSDGARGHFETCPRCASALASARRLEALLRSVQVPRAPETFTASVLQRVRRERWQSEQNVDRLFNVAIVVTVIVIVGAVAAMLNLGALFAVTESAWALMRNGTRTAMRNAAPTLITYVAAVGLLASALGMWWWAERKLQY
jgi:anti-sigma factor RsiW